MQSQSWHKKQKYHHESHIREKCEHDSSEFFLVHFIELSHPLCRGVPKNVGRDDIEQREYDAGDERTEEKIPEENDFVAFHYQWLSPGAMILFERSQVNHKAIPASPCTIQGLYRAAGPNPLVNPKNESNSCCHSSAMHTGLKAGVNENLFSRCKAAAVAED